MERWYVAKSKPHKESYLIASLSSMGIHAYFPYIVRPNSERQEKEALFPTYMFCLVDPQSSNWPAVRSAPGLAYFLGGEREPTPMDDELVRHIKSRVDHWNGGSFRERFSPGDKVLVASGALKDLEGIFQRYVSAHRRCMVLLDLMGRLASVELREPQLRGLDPGTGSLHLSKG